MSARASFPELSPTQARAVLHPLVDACVVAGAGSGKTRVLVARHTHLLRALHLPPRGIAALTFTEKAASEMRERIQSVWEAEGDFEMAAQVAHAPIGTLHSFSGRCLRRHAIEAGVDPDFKVLDAHESALLLSEAARRVERRLVAQASADWDALGLLAGGSAVRRDLEVFLGHLRGRGIAPEALTWAEVEGADLAARAERLRETLDELASALGPVESGQRSLEGLRARAGDLCAFVGDRDWLGAWQTFDEWSDLWTQSGLGKLRRAPIGGLVGAIKALRAGIPPEIADRWGRESLAGAIPRVLSQVAQTYERLKEQRGGLDFADLELRAIELLAEGSRRGRRPDLLPIAVLLDEAQDVSALQGRLLEHLRGVAPVFSVGDPKQSIYGFRGADVDVLVSERARVGGENVHVLSATYRAVPELVRALNGIHAPLFAGGAAGVPYEPLESAGSFREAESESEVLPLSVTLVAADPGAAIDEARALEARWIAQRIAAVVGSRIPRRSRGDCPAWGSDLSYGDIALLFRVSTSMDTYERALEEAGIPFITQMATGYPSTREFDDLLYLLRVVANPQDDFALGATLRGPAVGASEGLLLEVFAGRKGSAWDRLEELASTRADLRVFCRCVASLRVEAVAGRLTRLLERILFEMGLLEVALLGRKGARRAVNLRQALLLARDLEASGRHDLLDLIASLSEWKSREAQVGEAPLFAAGDDVVRLLTIHGAKGLEYPVVFVADVGRTKTTRRSRLLAGRDGHFGAALAHPFGGASVRPSGYAALCEDLERAQEQEERRLYYVATTRAREMLFLSAAVTVKAKNGDLSRSLRGWGKSLFDAMSWGGVLGAEPTAEHEVALPGGGSALLRRVGPSDLLPRAPAPVAGSTPAPADPPPPEASARDLVRRADQAARPHAEARYVVSVSELLSFAASPAGWRRRLLGLDEFPVSARLPFAASPEEEGAAPAREDFDEIVDLSQNRETALGEGRALHALLERWPIGAGRLPRSLIRNVLRDEGLRASDSARRVLAMARRFARSPTGRRRQDALEGGADVGQEIALHARVRFPRGRTAGGFDALLVRGTIDLWLPEGDGIRLVDYKTNRPSTAPGGGLEALAGHYAVQMRLYALMVERALGLTVHGASLLFLDAGWGREAKEVSVDVTGPRLLETRRLCLALARAVEERRAPTCWEDLLTGEDLAGAE